MRHPTFLSALDLEGQCELSFRRDSGPGGQNRNKVETAVVLVHRLSGIQGQASESRTQAENRAMARQRLRLALAVHYRTESCDEGLKLLSRYTRNGRISVSQTNADWPCVLAEVLNRLAENDWHVAKVAESLHVSSTQVIRLLAKHPDALAKLNNERSIRGLRKVR